MRLVALQAVILLLVGVGLGRRTSAKDALRQRLIQEAYSEHLARLKDVLPKYSGLPPLVDVSESKPDQGDVERAWEERFKGVMGFSTEIVDRGVESPTRATSISLATVEWGTHVYALPARSCGAVIIAEPVASEARVAQNRLFVYSRFSLHISQILKANRKMGIQRGQSIIATQFGGSVRFQSGHMETFLLAKEGFLERHNQYVLFIWKPAESKRAFMIAQPYLVDHGMVYPVSTIADASAYDGMPAESFEAKVRAAIAKNIDTD